MKHPVLVLALAFLCFPRAGHAVGQADPWDREWVQERTASVRVFRLPEAPTPPARLRRLESAVQRLAGELGLTDAQRASLRTDPIAYLYLPDAATVSWLGTDDVDGMALVAQRRIAATRLPHEHELVHVLAHLAISPSPANNHPWIQEGLASYLGGHLGESPRAVLALGDEVLDHNPGLIGRILTVDGFRGAALPSEQCYAASARFLQYLDESRGGRARILALLRLLAGQEDEVVARPASFVEVQLEGIYETTFDELLGGFEQWRRERPVAGVRMVAIPSRPADIVLSDDDHLVRWWFDEAGWVISAAPRIDSIDLALVWGTDDPEAGTWTSPPGASGYELRMTASEGRLLDHGAPVVSLRWFDDGTGPSYPGDAGWFFPASALEGVVGPGSREPVQLWSQPRFRMD